VIASQDFNLTTIYIIYDISTAAHLNPTIISNWKIIEHEAYYDECLTLLAAFPAEPHLYHYAPDRNMAPSLAIHNPMSTLKPSH